MSRLLRKKGLRNALWLAAEGRCQLCGRELPDGWHADHVVPWSQTGRTNVHEMQALCPECNLRKGARMLQPRRFQQEFINVLTEIVAGSSIRKIVPVITPGGGKSVLPVLAANKLIPAGMADFIAWIVPRLSLADQAETEFSEDGLGFNIHSYHIRQATNDVNPCRGTKGFVTTYQALGQDCAETILQAFDSQRGILVLDECHHIREGSNWHTMLKPILEKAVLQIWMSGNLTRGQGNRVAELPYTEGDLVDLNHPEWRFVRYGRRDALKDKAKIPVIFAHADGAARWLDQDGKPQEVTSLRNCGDKSSAAVFTAIQTEYADQLLGACFEDFENHRQFNNRRAKCLVVAYNIKEARRLLDIARSRGLRAGIAVCLAGDGVLSEGSRKAILRFKSHSRNAYDVLITVQMAYEGLDVPAITHLACLTHIRSWPWIEQMLDRGTRVDRHKDAPPWEAQQLRAFTPDDPKMAEAQAKIKAEQPDTAKEVAYGRNHREPERRIGCWRDSTRTSTWQRHYPLDRGSQPRGIVAISGTSRLPSLRALQRRSLRQCPPAAWWCSPLDFVIALDKLGIALPDSILSTPAPEQTESFHLGDLPPSLEEDLLRRTINSHCTKVDQTRGWTYGTANKLVKKHFGKSREDMTSEDLKRVWAWLQRRCPIREAQ